MLNLLVQIVQSPLHDSQVYHRQGGYEKLRYLQQHFLAPNDSFLAYATLYGLIILFLLLAEFWIIHIVNAPKLIEVKKFDKP